METWFNGDRSFLYKLIIANFYFYFTKFNVVSGEDKMLKESFLVLFFVFLIVGSSMGAISFGVIKAMNNTGSNTLVGGYISEDTTWTLEGSPYVVVEDVVVELGVTLTIEAGVIVKFTGGTNLVIDGALVAKGNTTHSITFTSNSTTPAPADWGSIHFRDSSDDALCEISYANIRYGTTGIIVEVASPELSYLNISDNSGNGIYINGYGSSPASPLITGCEISSNGQNGIELFGYSSSPIIANNTIKHNSGNGIYAYIWAYSVPNILHNSIFGNDQNAIYVDNDGENVLISNNELFENNGCGVHSRFASLQVVSNIIRGNQIGILVESFHADDVPVVTYNHLYNNSEYDIHASKYDIDATYNWWGTTNETAIDEHIYDYYDDYNLGKVFYKPYLVPPLANFTFSPEIPYAFGTITFDASASFNPYGALVNYTWNFGDSNVTSTSFPVITHIYKTPGNYNITLTVTDEFGLTNSTTTIIEVFQDNVSPVTTNEYDNAWHNMDFFINLIAIDNESGIKEIHYRINNGPIQNVSINGQPFITTENSNNTLEYWSIDNAGNEELPHKILTGIKLDKTAPIIETPSRIPEGDVQILQEVKVSVNITDPLSGVYNATLSYNLNDSAPWINLPMTPNSTTGLYEAVIPGQQANTLIKYKITVYDKAGNRKVEDSNEQYYMYTVIPEFSSAAILLAVMALSTLIIVLSKRKNVTKSVKKKRLGEESKF